MTRLEEVLVSKHDRDQMIGILMAGPTAEPLVVGVVKWARLGPTIAIECVVTIRAAGVGVIEVHAVRAFVTVEADLFSGLECIEVCGREIVVVAAIDVTLGSQRRAQMDGFANVDGIRECVRIVAAYARDVLLALAKHSLLRSFGSIAEVPALVW